MSSPRAPSPPRPSPRDRERRERPSCVGPRPYAAVEAIPLRAAEREPDPVRHPRRDRPRSTASARISPRTCRTSSRPTRGPVLLAETLKHALKEDPEQAKVFVDRMAAEVARLVGPLAGDLLTLSKLEEPEGSGQWHGHLGGESRLRTPASGRVQAAGTRRQSAAPGAVVLGDDVALSTLVRNLVDNAIRYTEPGGHLTVRVKRDGRWERVVGDAGGAGRWSRHPGGR